MLFGERVQDQEEEQPRAEDEGKARADRVGMSERGSITWA